MRADEYVVKKLMDVEKEMDNLNIYNNILKKENENLHNLINQLFSIAEINGSEKRRWIDITIWDDNKLFDELLDKVKGIEND